MLGIDKCKRPIFLKRYHDELIAAKESQEKIPDTGFAESSIPGLSLKDMMSLFTEVEEWQDIFNSKQEDVVRLLVDEGTYLAWIRSAPES